MRHPARVFHRFNKLHYALLSILICKEALVIFLLRYEKWKLICSADSLLWRSMFCLPSLVEIPPAISPPAGMDLQSTRIQHGKCNLSIRKDVSLFLQFWIDMNSSGMTLNWHQVSDSTTLIQKILKPSFVRSIHELSLHWSKVQLTSSSRNKKKIFIIDSSILIWKLQRMTLKKSHYPRRWCETVWQLSVHIMNMLPIYLSDRNVIIFLFAGMWSFILSVTAWMSQISSCQAY